MNFDFISRAIPRPKKYNKKEDTIIANPKMFFSSMLGPLINKLLNENPFCHKYKINPVHTRKAVYPNIENNQQEKENHKWRFHHR